MQPISKKNTVRFVRSVLHILSWFEIQPERTFSALSRFISYQREFRNFSKRTKWQVTHYPCLFDRQEEAATLDEYFWQDMYVAKKIIALNPNRHVDVGSRIDGFIAHLACVRHVEVLDLRPLNVKIENVSFKQWDITNPKNELNCIADCVSCLHTLEHIGLGRYGDTINPDGWKQGFSGLYSLLASGGVLWLSVPIGRERVEFNAHRIFNPQTIVDYARKLGLTLQGFVYVDDAGIMTSKHADEDMIRWGTSEYGLGIFCFHKK